MGRACGGPPRVTLPAPALIWCPFPDATSAQAAADVLLDEGLIACANLMPGMTSISIWQGQKQQDTETGVLMKTNAVVLERAIARLNALHPYEAPAILGWPCDSAAPATTAWLGALGAG